MPSSMKKGALRSQIFSKIRLARKSRKDGGYLKNMSPQDWSPPKLNTYPKNKNKRVKYERAEHMQKQTKSPIVTILPRHVGEGFNVNS